MALYRRQVGIIYGSASSVAFDVAVADGELKRLDYVEADQDGQRVLAQVDAVNRRSRLSFEDAIAIPEGLRADADDQLSSAVRVIGYRDAQGRIQTPRTPFKAGTPVYRAEDRLVTAVLGLENAPDEGAYLGHVKGSAIPVTLNMDTLAQKHVSVLAKTGAGKSYTVGVLLEEFLKARVPLVILDPHGEYGSLRNANIEESEMGAMVRFSIRPRSFAKEVKEFALDTGLNPDAERLVLEGVNLAGSEIAAMLGGRLSGGQVGVLYQAVKEVKEALPAYTLRDIMDAVARNKASSKWNVLNALEVLESTKLFDIRGTPVKELVQAGQCSIINLKGAAPDVQEIVVTRIANLLWEARKRSEVPAHILVVEEAHNFCPERNVANAVSGAILRTIASEGRKFGLGLLIVSQRPAKVDKNVLSQCNTQVVLKVTNPNDLKAIVQSVEGINNEVADEVQRLPVGVALVAGGGLTQPVFVDVRPRLTSHGGKSVSVLHQEIEEPDEDVVAPAPGEEANAEDSVLDDLVAKIEENEEAFASDGLEDLIAPKPTAPAGMASHDSQPLATPPTRRQTAVVREAARPPPDQPIFEFDMAVPTSPMAPANPLPLHSRPPPAAEVKVRTRKAWNAADAREIQRVAVRVGAVPSSTDSQRSLDILYDLAAGHDADPDARLRLYLEVAAYACHEQPACIRCPLRDHCAYHLQLVEERHKNQGLLGRLWRR